MFYEVAGLAVGYDGEALIEDIAFDLKRGEILTLIGPNGAGKSTILKSLTKHLSPIKGTVTIEGCGVESLSLKELSKRQAVVLTEKLKLEMMTCWELVSTGRYPYTGQLGFLKAEDVAQVEAALLKVDALALAHRDFNTLSDGQKQRILLARAICQAPEVIVLDEPTSFLDVKHKLELLKILKDMAHKEGITVLMSLHEIDLAQKIANKVLCVKGTRIYRYGTPETVFQEAIIQELYEMAQGSYNVCFGSLELAPPNGTPEVFVISGNGTGIPCFRALQKQGIPFYAGVLHENDVDCQVAVRLARQTFVEKAFEKISTTSFEAAKKHLANCRYVVDTGAPIGEMNSKNRELVEWATSNGKVVLTGLDAVQAYKDRWVLSCRESVHQF